MSAFASLLDRARGEGRTLVMGILNVTPDSFSDGGRFEAEAAWRARAEALLAEGADVVDVGGESTRPGSSPVDAAEQCRRVLGPIRFLARELGACVSVDTTSPAVAERALGEGAALVNDVSCLADPALAGAAARAGAWLLVMHSRGSMGAMRGYSDHPKAAYADVAAEVRAELGRALERARAAGLPEGRAMVDPGLGFHKNAEQSYALLAALPALAALGAPVAVGASRKSFLARDVAAPPARRLGGTVAACLLAARLGAELVRVHDVLEVRQALAVQRRLLAPLEASLRALSGSGSSVEYRGGSF
ncbi:MAG TPA: dihydropteroate synthase, partial [Polyangiaceae bacterium]|nr:dihydropteroate synthase [Polyangiaceae bacterium]